MTHAVDLTAREAEVIRILRTLRSRTPKFVVIGGYAVNALTSHRFSVDCDLVVSEKRLKSLEDVLTADGYTESAKRQLKGIHGARTLQYVKLIGGRSVSVDVYVNSVVCRQTRGMWSYELISQNSSASNVIGVTDFVLCLVPRRELLIAMKLHSGRATDLRDVVMLSEDCDWRAVAKFASTGIRKNLIAQLNLAMKKVSSKEFQSSLRAEFALRSDITRLIRDAMEHLNVVRDVISKIRFGEKSHPK